MGKDIKQGDDDGMKNEYEGVHLAPAPEKSRGGFVILWVKVGVGRWHFSVFWCVRVLVYWCVGVSVYRCISVSVCRCVGVSVYKRG